MNIRRLLVLGGAFFLFVALGFAQDEDFSKVQIKVTKVAGSVYMLEGSGGNIGASVGDDGIVIVDDQYAPLADKIQTAMKGITDKPVRFVINTHYHGDHTGEMSTSRSRLRSSRMTMCANGSRRREGRKRRLDFLGSQAGREGGAAYHHFRSRRHRASERRGYPRAIFSRWTHRWRSVIFFPKSNVVHMGDDFVTYGFPFIDVDSGGSIEGMIDGVEKVLTQVPADVKIIPGHGPISNLDDVRAYLKC